MPRLPELIGGANAGQHEQLGRSDCPGAQDDLFAFDDEQPAVAINFHAGSAVAVESDAMRQDIGPDGKVEAMAAGVQVGDGGTHAYAAGVVQRYSADAGGIGMVHILVFREAGVTACLIECRLQRQPGLSRVPPNRDGAVAAMKIISNIGVAFQPTEVGQRLLVTPLVVTRISPGVEVLRDSAQQDLVVDGAAATGHTAPGHMEWSRLLGSGLAHERPVMGRSLLGGGLVQVIFQLVGQPVRGWVIRPGFQQEHGSAGVFGQSVGKNTASRASPDDDDVIFHTSVRSALGFDAVCPNRSVVEEVGPFRGAVAR